MLFHALITNVVYTLLHTNMQLHNSRKITAKK